MNRWKKLRLIAWGIALLNLAGARLCGAEDPKDILWYGNSFTNATCCGSTRSVPNIFRDVAIAAGRPAPVNRNAAVDGQTLQYHLTNNTSVITTGIAPGGQWENVVLQDYSTWPTHIGNLPQHLTSSLALYQKVAMHSPNVVPVMYETWARGYGDALYAGVNPSFPGGPTQMQQELRDGYHLSTDNINAAVGAPITKLAPAGDAWELANFPANFYGDGSYHASNRGSLLNALVLYGTIYGDPTTSDINLASVLTTLNLSAADGVLLTGLADRTLVPEPTALVLTCLGGLLVTLIRRRQP
ncbi:MAG: PEP-CTERM sorting domain-containing protein [Pirellulales bacterium]